uniref:Junctophilin n=1 Tax=Macrostomum lignano TaxID=282301 RepID=A0A1I8GIU4_9PLAT
SPFHTVAKAAPSMTTDGGRFDFEDGGTYVGGWSEGKAHGLGLVTGPRGQGEFAGLWEDGFEASGVYIWPSGNTFEGEWRQGKRHGLGTEVKGRWMYRGEWMTGFKGRYGVRQSEASGARYEGTWQLGMQDGTGVETYSDGSTYSGCWFHGTRHGLGIRQSVPFGLAAHYKEERRLRESLTSLRSQDEASAEAAAAQDARERAKRLDEPRGGFVLRGRMIDAAAALSSGQAGQSTKRNSLTKGLIGRLRKQRSTGDVNNDQRSSARYSGSLRSALSDRSATLTAGGGVVGTASPDFFEEIVDPSTTEAYYGDWKQDKRSGLGVAERSDGLKYEGEWEDNKKHGYGCTTFPDGSVEAGKYKSNVLVASTARRSKLFIIKTARLRERVETAVREARNAMAEAIKKAENAQSRQQVSRQKAELADQAAEKARQDAEMARRLAHEYAPDFHQPGSEFLKRRLDSDALNSLSLTSHQNGSKPSGVSANSTSATTTSAAAAAAANSRTLQRQRNIEESPGLSPPQQQGGGGLQVDGILQVGGGGSRRGSFRAVRRGSGGGGGGGGEAPPISQNPTVQQAAGAPSSAAPAGPDVNEVVTRLQAAPAAAQNPQLRRQ